MINKKLFFGVAIVVALAYGYRTITFNCGPGCTTDPEKIAAGCPACPTQEPAVEVVIPQENCEGDDNQPTEDFFHDSVYMPATEDV